MKLWLNLESFTRKRFQDLLFTYGESRVGSGRRLASLQGTRGGGRMLIDRICLKKHLALLPPHSPAVEGGSTERLQMLLAQGEGCSTSGSLSGNPGQASGSHRAG